ncbi:hypothetical protein C7H19_23440 [Aphanothece hegewaldii CCALA 016]|uniref:Outer membrane protein beta-barrel domain-containing protein n=1 Tax=Aphanothece hegewaldii CCALA 016 TaxID=2107694 RepID=A0A2T1LR81_9CHRO|nr:hypothetical protein [Aphanothece hegewaldii]PSF30982.1 hypothetical protein C7H19_23440 [Aphanothece hegewaldii CCALA 016]
MLKLLQKKHSILLLQWLLVGSVCFVTNNANANPLSIIPAVNHEEEANDHLAWEHTSSKKINEIPESSLNSSCSDFTPITNTLKPNESSLQKPSENQVVPNSACAADLLSGGNTPISQLTPEEIEAPKPEETQPTETPTEITPDTPPNNTEETQVVESKDWHIDIQPYATIPVTTYGSVTAGNRSVDYHLSLGELLDVLRVTASGRIEAWKGNFGLIFDGYYVSLHGTGIKQVERPVVNARLESDLTFDQGIYDFALSYHIGARQIPYQPTQPSKAAFPRIWFTPIVGTRLNDISTTIKTTLTFNRLEQTVEGSGSRAGRTWFEPLVGGKIGLQISEPITFWARGDVSGFGLAGETDLSWNAIFGLDWWVNPNISLNVAYRFYQIKYGNGSGDNAFKFEQNFNGPYLAITFRI